MKITADMKRYFFDRKAVIDAIGREEAARLSKAGAFIRTAARSLLRRRKKASAPGSPPSVHAPSGQTASLKTIFFAWDPGSRSVVVGPLGLNQRDALDGKTATGTVPQLHEFGGASGVLEVRWKDGGEWRRFNQRRRRIESGQEMRRRTSQYPARPFMAPSLKKTVAEGKVLDVWSNSVKAG